MDEIQDNQAYAALLDPALPDLDVAIAGLRLSVQALGKNIAAQSAWLEQEKARRKLLRETQVQRLLPDFSGSTLRALTHAYPDFVDALVQETFRENSKILGLFTRSGSEQALLTLKTRLAFYLDRHSVAESHALDQQIDNIKDAIDKLEQARFADMNLLQTLENLKASNAPISDAMQYRIRQLAAQTRQLASRPPGVGNLAPEPVPPSSSQDHNQYFANEDYRAWMYLNSGTLNSGTLAGGNNENTAPQTSSGSRQRNEDCDTGQDREAVLACFSDNSRHSASAAEGGEISTDDSLGRFS